MSPNPAVLSLSHVPSKGEGFKFRGFVKDGLPVVGSGPTARTFVGVGLGTPTTTRTVIVIATYWSGGNRNVVSCNVGGVEAVSIINAGGGPWGFSAWRATVPTGITADIQVWRNDDSLSTTISVWTHPAAVFSYDAGYSDVPTGSTTMSPIDLQSRPNGLALAGFTSRSSVFNTTWSGLSERWDTAVNQPTSGADLDTTGAPVTISAAFSNATSNATTRLGYVTFAEAKSGGEIYDSFDRLPTFGHALGLTTSGHKWIHLTGSGLQINTGGVAWRNTNPGGFIFSVVDAGFTNMKVSTTVAVPGPYFAGPVARCAPDGLTCYLISTESNGSFVRLNKLVNGTTTIMGGGVNNAYVAGDEIGLSCVEEGTGTRITISVNDVVLVSTLDTDTGRPMGTMGGLRPYNNSNIRFDDFRIDSA